MKIKKVYKYYCDFCKKSGGSKYHLQRHESSCTLNPNRVCRVCKMLKVEQQPINELITLLPDIEEYKRVDYSTIEGYPHKIESHYFSDGLESDVNLTLKELRVKCNNCPACILAAIRQAKIPVPLVTDFNFTNEMKAVWTDINEETLERYGDYKC